MKKTEKATTSTMQEHNKKDEENLGKDVDNFRDNAEGTTSLKEFLEQVGRCGENVAGRTGKNIYTGNQGVINENTSRDEITQMYDDLVVARARGAGYDRDAYEYGEVGEDGTSPWRWTDATIRSLNVKIRKMMRDAWNLLLTKTRGADAWEIVQLTEHQDETSRLNNALRGLKEAYEDYAPHEKRTAKTRMQGLLVFKVKKKEGDPDGIEKFRTWRNGDDVVKFLYDAVIFVKAHDGREVILMTHGSRHFH